MKVFFIILQIIVYTGIGIFIGGPLVGGNQTAYYAVGAFVVVVLMAMDALGAE